MPKQTFLKEIKDYRREHPKIDEILDIYRRSKEIYEEALNALAIPQKQKYRGTYSSSLSKENYNGDISTTT